MKKIFLMLGSLLCIHTSTLAQNCDLNDMSNSNNWTQEGTNGPTITNGNLSYNNVTCNQSNGDSKRVTKDALNFDLWRAEFEFRATAWSNPAVVLLNYSSSIGSNIESPNGNTVRTILLGTGGATPQLILNAGSSSSAGIGIELSRTYFIRMSRTSATQATLQVFSDIAMLNQITGSPQSVNFTETITGLSFLQSGVSYIGNNDRSITATIDNINLFNLPPAITGANSVCTNQTTTFSNTITGGSWSSSNTAVATVNSSTGLVTGVSAGTATISYTIAGCSTTVTRDISVIASPTVAAVTGANTVCRGQLTVFSNTTPNGVWSSGSPTNATVSNLGVVTGISEGGISRGAAQISYTVTNSNGCSTTRSKLISVIAPPTFTISGNTLVCPNSSSGYSVTPITANTKYYWVVDDNITMSHDNGISTSIKVGFPDKPGTSYTVKAISVNACGSSPEVSKIVTINPDVAPKPILTCSGTNCQTLSVNNPGAGVTVQWFIGGILNTSLNGLLSISRTSDTQTEVRFTKGSCSYSAFYFPAYCVAANLRLDNSTTTSGISNYDSPLKIYPNPNEGTFTFTTKGYNGKAIIMNSIGSIIQEIEVDETRTSYNISINNMPSGTYLLKLTGDVSEQNGIFIIK